WSAAIAWQFIAAVSLLFLYGHLDIFWRGLIPFYAWFRDQRIIEAGLYKYNFYRVFMQSGIWALTGFFIFLSLWLKSRKPKLIKKFSIFNFQTTILIFILTTLIISLSRSFWLAGFFTFIAFIIFYLYKKKPKLKTLLHQSINLAAILIASFAIIAITLLIPIGQIPGLKSLSFLEERTTETEEPAISSRWDLLPVLWQKIKPDFLLGRGFGATVTYKTSDPRYLQAHPNNPYYTTFAFEWGWLDIWYKIGLLGLLTYALLIGSILKRGVKVLSISSKSNIYLYQGLFFGLIALIIVNFFTPFLNHPLGIGYLLLTDACLRQYN
ncbi:MAG: O-antigen ligase family protein, partial [Candidatus Jacksonbacteria bacterium]